MCVGILIHKVYEAFEELLSDYERTIKKTVARGYLSILTYILKLVREIES